MTYSHGTVVKWQKRGHESRLKVKPLGAVSTWMGDLIRIPTEGFDFFCFHFIYLFIYFLLLIFIL